MPFDSTGFEIIKSRTMTMLEKYKELLRLIDGRSDHGYQGSYETCLWSEARLHKPFLDAGLPVVSGFPDSAPPAAMWDFFGAGTDRAFGVASISFKRKFIKQHIEKLSHRAAQRKARKIK